jgi:predicted MFS family arabinose efflux permease
VVGNAAGILSITFYTQGLFAGPVTAAFGWSRSEFFLGFTVLQFSGLVTAPVVGSLIDRYGARMPGIAGLVGHAACYLLLSQATGSLALFYASFAALAVCAAGSLPVTWTTIVNAWFDARRGLAIGLTMAGIGAAAVIAPPFTEFLLASAGWRVAYAGLGLGALVLALPVVLAWLHEPPGTRTDPDAHGHARVWGVTRPEALRDRRFWTIGGALVVITLSVIGLIPNFVPLLRDSGWTLADATRAATLLGVAVIAGRLLAGYLVDHVWAPAVAALFFAGPALAVALLSALPVTPALAFGAALLLGLAAGAELDLLAYLTSRYFGTAHYGAVFGGIYAFFSVGSGLAPLAYAAVHDLSGSYRPMLAAAAVAIVVAVALLLSLGPYPRADAKTR